MLKRHFFFDVDGTAVDSSPAAIEAFGELRENLFHGVPPVEHPDDWGNVFTGPLMQAFSPVLTEFQTRAFFDCHSAMMARKYPSLKLFSGIGELFRAIGPKHISFVTSAYSDKVAALIEQQTGLRKERFHCFAGREWMRRKSEKIRHILTGLRMDPADAIYVGDLESDLIYCRKVPVDCVLVTYGYLPKSYISTISPPPTQVVDSVEELKNFLISIC